MSQKTPHDFEEQFRIEVREQNDALVAALIGPAGAAQGDVFAAAMDRLAKGDESRVVIDLSRLTFLSTMGISAIMNLHRALAEKGRELRIAATPPIIAGVFRNARLGELLSIYPTLSEALVP